MSREMRCVKEYLFKKYGCRCEVCKRSFKPKELTGHHIIMKSKGGKVKNTNILIVCYYCHFVLINSMKYNSKEYWTLMRQSLEHRNPEDKGNFPCR